MSVPSDVLPVHALILRHAETAPARTALIHPAAGGYRHLSYGALAARVARAARALATRGVGPGDRVVILVPMSPDLYVSLLAVASLGAVAVFVEPASTAREIARVVEVARPRALVGVPLAHALRAVYPAVGRVPVRVVVGSRGRARLLGAPCLAELEEAAGDGAPPPLEAGPDDPVLLTFSSGSTGTPKGATRSHAFLTAQHHAICGLLERREGVRDIDLSAFAIVLLSSLVSGMTAVIPRLGRGGVDRVDGDGLLALIEAERVSVISGSPAFLAPIAAAAGRGARPLASVRRVISGGAPVPLSLVDALDERALPSGTFLVVYGSTEAEPISTIDAADIRRETGARTRAGAGLCVGRLDPHLSLRLLRPSAAPLEVGPGGLDALCVAGVGEVGEVAVSGPHVNRRYYRNAAAERATKVVDERGAVWHRTGDAGYLDDEGRLWIVGRIADIVMRDGVAYHPAAVEALAQEVPGVGRAALIAGDDGATVLVVQPRGGGLVGAAAARWRRSRLAASLEGHLAAAGIVVDHIRFSARLPVDSRHRAKLDYPAIRAAHARQPARTLVRELVRKVVA